MDPERIRQLNEKWKHVMDDPVVNRLTTITMINDGIPFADEDPDAMLLSFGEGAEYFSEIYKTL